MPAIRENFMKRRLFAQTLTSATLLACGALATLPAQAEPLSNRPIRIVVPFGAGGVADVTARVVGQQLSTQLGQPVVIDNKPSAGGIVAADAVAKATPDGHTLFLMSNGSAVTVGLFKHLPFDMVKDLAPISTLGYFDIGVITDGKSQFKTLPELLAYAKAHPGKLNIGSIAIGSTQHLAAELFRQRTGLTMTHVAYKGGAPAVVDLMNGQVSFALMDASSIVPQMKSGRLRVLGVASPQRLRTHPDIPTLHEQGLANYEAFAWQGLLVPTGTAPEVVNTLSKGLEAVMKTPSVIEFFDGIAVEPWYSSPADMARFVTQENQRWGKIIREQNISLQ